MTLTSHPIIKLTTAIFLLCFSLWGYTDTTTKITMLLSGESRLYYDAVDGVTEELDSMSGLDYELTTISDLENIDIKEIGKKSDYIIVVGTKALRFITSTKLPTPTLNILVSKRTYQFISKNSKSKRNYSVIYLDQPAERLMLLAKLVLNSRVNNIGMLFGPTSVSEKQDYISAANKLRLKLVSKEESSDKASLDVIESLIKETSAYVALYDRDVLNRKIAKWLLYMANVNRKPVIAYSRSYVEAGAVAAVYTTPTDAGRSAANWLSENINSTRRKIWNRYPQRFTVDINKRIATRLNLSIDNPDVISAKIKAAEVKND